MQDKTNNDSHKGRLVYIATYGCQMNVRDSEVVAGILMDAGFEITDDTTKADVIIFNTCSVRQHAEDKVWSEVGRIVKECARYNSSSKRKTHNAIRNTKIDRPLIGIIGCMAQNYKQEIFTRSKDVDFVVGPSDIHRIPGIIERLQKKWGQSPKGGDSPHFLSHFFFERKIWETDGEFRPEEIYHTGFYEDKKHAFVVISEGCSNFCSYCVVPFTRGPLRHRKYKDIIKEIKQALDAGLAHFTLLGQNVNAYKDGEFDFIKLLETVNGLPQLKEFSFITSHPKDTAPALFKAMAELDKLRKYLHLPVQSGSDKILNLMHRGYTRKKYLDLIDKYRKIVKKGLLSSDIIVGYPGETEEDFRATYELVKYARFDTAYIFKYSPRPNTEAAKTEDDVVKPEKERRHSLILQLQKQISLSKRKR